MEIVSLNIPGFPMDGECKQFLKALPLVAFSPIKNSETEIPTYLRISPYLLTLQT